MKIIMVAAVSKDSFITKSTNPSPGIWTSDEDKNFFATIKSKHRLLVMGSTTYDSGLVVAKPGTLKLILTSNPENYYSQESPRQLEFKNLSAQEIKDIYDSEYATCLLLGGGYTYTQFLEANLVDEIYLTIEPVINKTGIKLCSAQNYFENFGFELLNTRTLNTGGTILKHYVLKK